ncbi:MAG: amino acid racemase [Actinomycetaceae bacterium]|nr:amino acid racemase [Actinomycetaceae bacterium]
MNHRRVGGVLGGLGPLATAYFLQRIVLATDAQTDQEHIDLIITQRSSTPDRTAAIQGKGPSPKESLNRDISLLVDAGADFITAPCNSSMVFLTDAEQSHGVPFLSIIDETVKAARVRYPQASTLALLATEGTIASGLYREAAEKYSFELIEPDRVEQQQVTDIIYRQVKANQPINEEQFFSLCDTLTARRAEVIITGCTELSVAVEQLGDRGRPIVDSLASLAEATILEAGGKVLATD